MARLTVRDGYGKPDLVACFHCDLMGKEDGLKECGGCEHFQAAIDKLCEMEEALMWMNKRVEDRIERNVLGTMEK